MSAEPSPATLDVIEYTDPMCPWAWASEPTFRRLRRLAGPDARWRRVLGVMFDDDDDPAPDEAAETRWYQRYLAGIASHTGMPYPVALERVARTSRPASLAVIAAAEQGTDVADRVLYRLRERMFLTGRPPDTAERVAHAIVDVPGLDLCLLRTAIGSSAVAARLARDVAETRAPVPELDLADALGPHPGRAKETDTGRRYAFPTVLLRRGDRIAVVPGYRPWAAYADAVARLAAGVTDRPNGPAPAP